MSDESQTPEGETASIYSSFKVLLDDPAEKPGLRFGDYAAALAGLIRSSRAAFSVGILGGWGSGKTTLMREIERVLADDDNVVTVRFTAWRYEREPHLIVPLLDVLREALADRAGKLEREKKASAWARDAAIKVAQAGQAFLAGLTITAGLPTIQGALNFGPVLDQIKANTTSPGPLSLYHSSFGMLREAISDLSANGTRRLVIFVDDLDRCLPSSALYVLESMKLFFDVEGCVFVVGLDLEIVDRAVSVKFDVASKGELLAPTAGGYVEKLFQVQFTLPKISAGQLKSYLDTIKDNSDFAPDQCTDFDDNVRRHFRWIKGEESINPREIKRLINTYTLQLKMLEPLLGAGLNTDVVLALLCLSSRPIWRPIYAQLSADPNFFQSAMKAALEDEEWPAFVWLSGTDLALPREFLEYLRGDAAPLLRTPDLESYVSAVESLRSTDPSVLDARTIVSRLRRSLSGLSSSLLEPTEVTLAMLDGLESVHRLVSRRRELLGWPRVLREQIESEVSALAGLVRELARAESEPEAGPGPVSQAEHEGPNASLTAWAERAIQKCDRLDELLQELHQYVTVGSY